MFATSGLWTSVKGEDRFLKSTDARAYRAIVLLHSYSPPPRVSRGGGAVRICIAQLLEKVGNRGKKVAEFSGKDGARGEKIGVGLIFSGR